jgi:hypothetical protein
MPVTLVCPICGKRFECDGKHEPHRDDLAAAVKCPLNKGSIHVFVKDDAGNGVTGVATKSSGHTETDLGFAFFDRLDAGAYPTSIDLGASVSEVASGYYTISDTGVTAKVEPGKITLVEFALIRYGAIRAVLKGTDDAGVLARVEFKVNGSSSPTKEGKADFDKRKPTEDHTVTCALGPQDTKNFKLVKAEEPDQKVRSARTTEVVFQVTPRYWVDLVLVDPKDDKLTGAFSLLQGADPVDASDVGADVKHVPDLKSGTVDVKGITLLESREFVSIT